MYFREYLPLLLIPSVCIVSCTFVSVTRQPFLSVAWAFKYDPGKGVAAMRNSLRPVPNDTCHIFKLTDQERHDIHTFSGEFKVEIMMYEAILTQHGQPMTAQELNSTSYYLWKFCEHQKNFMKYNFFE